MQEQINKDQMIYETYIVTRTLKERMDRHSSEHSLRFDKIWNELKEIRELVLEKSEEDRKVREEHEKRIAKLELERNIGIKIIVPIISAIVAFFTALIGKKLTE